MLRSWNLGICFIAVLTACAPHGWSGELRAPLATQLCPTSSFGSWRTGHLHAGLDLSTGGVTGVPVLAVDSCWIWRIRIWNAGYGKALYAQLGDGTIAVYGHLSGFCAEMESLVEKEQDLKQTYEVDIYPQPYAFRYCPGETLAFSGETGSGPPHLHFELRSGQGDHTKINPVPSHLVVPETLSPSIDGVRLVPLSSDCRLDRAYREVDLGARAGADTISVSGRFGVCVRAIDAGRCGKTLTPVVYEARIDDTILWRLDFDAFPFDKSHFEGALYRSVGGRPYVCLFASPDLDMRGFNAVTPDLAALFAGLADGPHTLALRVEDAWGNADSFDVPLLYGSVPQFAGLSTRSDSLSTLVEMVPEDPDCRAVLIYRSGSGPWLPADLVPDDRGLSTRLEGSGEPVEVLARLVNPAGFVAEAALAPECPEAEAVTATIEIVVHPDFMEIYGRSECLPSGLPVASVYQGSWLTTLVLQPLDRNVFRAVYVPKSGCDPVHVRLTFDFGARKVDETAAVTLARMEPGSEARLLGEKVWLKATASKDLRCGGLLAFREAEGSCPKGFAQAAGRVILEPSTAFFDIPIDLLLVARGGDVDSTFGVFSERGGKPGFLARFGQDGTCSFGLRTLCSLAVLEDTDPPRIACRSHIDLRRDGKGCFHGRVVDEGAGVDAATIRGFVDDGAAIVSYDPDTGTIEGRTIKPLRYGVHRIRLEAKDRLGNSARAEVTADLLR